MGKYWSITIKCPFCSIEQSHFINKSMEMHAKGQNVICWNSDMQQGCKQPFEVVLSCQVAINRTIKLDEKPKEATP